MEILTFDCLKQILPNNKNIDKWYSCLNLHLPNIDVVTVERVAAFMAQCCVESTNFTRLTENLNYSASALNRVWAKRFPTLEIAKQYERKPEKIANKVYANRMGNGDERSGDGWKYRGRGLIQLTGKSNYLDFSRWTDIPLEECPNYLETMDGATLSACYFWDTRNLNKYADIGDITRMTKIINGGTHGLQERINNYNKFTKILKR